MIVAQSLMAVVILNVGVAANALLVPVKIASRHVEIARPHLHALVAVVTVA